jgi:hypothetical protein
MKNAPLILGIILLLLLSAGGYWYMKKSPSSQITGNNKMMANQTTGGGMMSMKDLLALGKDQTCTFSTTSESGTVNGSSYMSGGKVRTNFNGTYPDGKSYDGGMISDGAYVYSWTTDTKQGFKMAMTDSLKESVEDVKKDFENNPNKYVNQDEKMDYKCSSWPVDKGMFDPPSDITFTDYSEMMKKVQDSTQANPEMKAAQCQACDSMPEGENKTMCKQTLGCN